jgi:uncharacterized protein (TIRG00374 family)
MVSFLREISRKTSFRIAMSLLILGLLLRQLPLSDLGDTISKISLVLWTLCVVAFLAGHILGVFKWRLWVNTGSNSLSLKTAFRCYFAGLFASLFLPSLAGGDVLRAGLAIRTVSAKEGVVLGTFLDRFFDTVSLAVLILAGAFFSAGALTSEDRRLLYWIFVPALIVAVIGTIFCLLPFQERFPGKAGTAILRLRNMIQHLIKNPQRTLMGFALGTLIQGGFVLISAFLGTKCGIDLPLSIWFLAWPLAKLSAMLPISMGGLGVREVVLATVLSRYAIPYSNSVGIGLLWETIIMAGSGLGGVFYYFSRQGLAAGSISAVK